VRCVCYLRTVQPRDLCKNAAVTKGSAEKNVQSRACFFLLQPDGELAPETNMVGYQFDPSMSLPADGQFKF